MKTVYLSLGSNLGNRELMLQKALERLEGADLHIRRISTVYETEPMYWKQQRWFLNLVAEAQTRLFPIQLLARVQKTELALGRKRSVANGPRSIDIDILFYGSFVIDTGCLTVPHPGAHERRFVLQPMVELAPDFRHPVLRVTMRELLGSAPAQALRRSEFTAKLLS